MRWTILFALLGTLTGAARLTAADKPVPVKDAASKMTVPEGFRVTLFAGEPDVVQPIAFTFDDRGRMWVVECVTYPKWVQPGQKGKDRVIILEDADGDGTHDKKTVVLDDGVNLSGIELGFGGVYLCSTPNLLFIPIKDDKPAGPPEVLLDGWNLKEAKHNVFNGLAWGPDGWLYGCNGIQTKSWVGKPGTPQKDRTYLDCGVWRYHPTRKVFEVFAHGTTNPWGLDWDDYGEMFITNCVIDHLWHVVPGGHYQRMHGQDPNPYTFGLMGPCSDHRHWGGGHWTTARADQKTGAVQKAHGDAGGGHAHSGCMVYLGDNFPANYRNSLFTCNIHGNRLNRDTLHRQGSGYVGKHAPDFLFANDPWFRGICVKQGPEGAVYVSDWCDTGECHNYDVADTTNGRIYRVTFGSPKPFKGDVSSMLDIELVKLQLSKNEWLVRKARRVMHERAIAGRLDAAAELRDILSGHPDLNGKLRALWALHAIGAVRDYTPLFQNDNEYLRAWAVRLAVERVPLGVEFPLKVPFLRQLVEAAEDERSPLVRLNCASAMRGMASAACLPMAGALCSRPEDNADPNLSLAYWYGLQPAVISYPSEALKLVPKIANHRVRENIVKCVLATAGNKQVERLTEVTQLLRGASDVVQLDILRGIRDAYADGQRVTEPAGWIYQELMTSPSEEVRELAESVSLTWGDIRPPVTMRARIKDPKASAESRRRAIERLVAHKDRWLGQDLLHLLSDPVVRGAAIRGLAAYPELDVPAAILKHYPTFTADEKADAVLTLTCRADNAAALLDAIEKGTVPKSDVTAFAARQIQALNDKRVSEKLAKVWGTVKPASQTRAAQTAKLKLTLTPDALRAADLANGRAVYARSCAACHKLFGEGGDVGPELTGSQRANLDYVLENVLDPNAAVPYDFKMTAFYLADGRVVTGLIRKETSQAVTVRTANEEVVIPKADIESRKSTNNSVMPEGLIDALKDEDVRDLVAYLASPKQVPPK